MNCPTCQNETKVIDSRVDEQTVRRRRECIKCGARFTTYERIELSVMVIKRDNRLEPYDRQKVLDGVKRASKNRPNVLSRAEEIISRIEQQLMQKGDNEISSREIGELVMQELKQLDPVAYLRFTSVCRSFEDLKSFEKELKTLKS